MEPIQFYHDLTEGLVSGTGMSHNFLHVQAGLAIFVLSQFLLRNRRASFRSLQIIFTLEIANEIMERLYYGQWRAFDTLSDIALTMLWPTMLVLVSHYRRRRWEREFRVKQQLAELMSSVATRESALAVETPRVRRRSSSSR